MSRKRLSRLAYVAVLGAFVGLVVACTPPEKTETVLYESAEVHYRRGDYQRALDGYESFLKLYPESPLADVAQMRIRGIKREVTSVLGRSDIPRPKWIPPNSTNGDADRTLDAIKDPE